MSLKWTSNLKKDECDKNSQKLENGAKNSINDIFNDDSEEEKKAKLDNAMKLCSESSGLMATVSTLRSTLQSSKRVNEESSEENVKDWGSMEPLTLSILTEALKDNDPPLPPLTHSNAAQVCPHVTTLSLQFKGLGSMDLAWLLSGLTKLEVSNNNLTSIAGLERLTSLKWLDLSFNKIRRVTGIGSLRHLEVLALHNNQIDKLDRLALQPLTILSIITLAHNNITSINDVWTLRQVKNLSSVSLSNNPICDDRYPELMLAYLPNLAYLDNRRITTQIHNNAAKLYRDEVRKVEEEEEKARKREEEEGKMRKSREEHSKAGVLSLDDGSLFDRMFRGDKHMSVLLHLPGAHTLMQKYRDQFNGVCVGVFKSGLEHSEKRDSELQLLRDALDNATQQADEQARRVVKKLEEDVEEMMEKGRRLREEEENSLGDDQEAHETRVKSGIELQEKTDLLLNHISDKLLTAEVTLADQIKDVINRAKFELGGQVENFLASAASEFEEGRRLAYHFYTKLRELATKVVEEGGCEIGEDPRTERVFEGADTLTVALASIHDRHLALIDAREKDLTKHLNSWLKQTLQHLTKEEWIRHRSRVEEITTLTARQRQLLYDALPNIISHT